MDRHIRIVTDTTALDVLGGPADALLQACAPLVAWFHARDPEIQMRAIACDLTRERLVIGYQTGAGFGAQKPIALKLEPPESEPLMEIVRTLLPLLIESATRVLAARSVT